MSELYLAVLAGLLVVGVVGVVAFCELRIVKVYRSSNARLLNDLNHANNKLHAASLRNAHANEEIRTLEDKLRVS